MLDTETKNRINTARDILVGKVPDPKSQVEQITIALIYKFMDDMDKESIGYGGEPSFFTGEFEQFGWSRIFDPTLSGIDTLNLYSEAIAKLNDNDKIPRLFRDIFKNAYLPYHDPETLKLFLKTINEFTYDHSEKLGDAFEYLLSVLGSQGDAGQFRTPRHIIDFIVEVLQPKKNETILDPACGTAGFLISSYKHIVKENTKKINGDLLTPDDRKRITDNFAGYDISPDMVRLSLVNLYLHNFTAPNIHEYDTLTTDTCWGEYFDIIMANPPFMTPKGGIKPHKRFTVQANRSEVLFVDYIAEHIHPTTGRAGIIVPEGIIFKSEGAYKSLRKMLVKDYLYAVVSLPAGIFQPYSGVKTSILFLDKTLAKKTDKILFVKVDNDGFSLGTQRRENDNNDLPLALEIFNRYKESIQTDLLFSIVLSKELKDIGLLVDKEKILSNKDVALSRDRYVDRNVYKSNFEIARLGDICSFKRGPFGGSLKKESFVSMGNLVYEQYHAINDDFDFGRYFIDDLKFEEMKGFEVKPNDLLISCSGTMGKIAIIPSNARKGIINQALLKLTPNSEKVYSLYLKKVLETELVQEKYFRNQDGATIQNVASVKVLKEIEIPLPPLEIQQQIVTKIETYQKIIAGARQVVENYKPQIDINPEWEMEDMGAIAKLIGGGTPSKENSEYWENGTIDWITCSDFSKNPMYIENSIRKITEKGAKESSTNVIPKGTLVMVTRVSLGKFAFVKNATALNQDLTALIFDENKVHKKYAYFFLLSISDKIEKDSNGVTVKGVSRDYVKEINIPLPSLEEQTTIVNRIEREQSLVNANKELIKLYEQKIKDEINKLWQEKEVEVNV